MYVTLGALPDVRRKPLVNSRVERLIFGAYDPKAGSLRNAFRTHEDGELNHRREYDGRNLDAQCGAILKEYFQRKENQLKEIPDFNSKKVFGT